GRWTPRSPTRGRRQGSAPSRTRGPRRTVPGGPRRPRGRSTKLVSSGSRCHAFVLVLSPPPRSMVVLVLVQMLVGRPTVVRRVIVPRPARPHAPRARGAVAHLAWPP